MEAFLRRSRGQEEEMEVVGERIVPRIVEGLVEEVVKLSA